MHKIASRKEPQMQYALLIYTKPGAAEALGAQEQEANHREYLDIRKLPGVVGGAALHPVEAATTAPNPALPTPTPAGAGLGRGDVRPGLLAGRPVRRGNGPFRELLKVRLDRLCDATACDVV
jgi:hypothetical protein